MADMLTTQYREWNPDPTDLEAHIAEVSDAHYNIQTLLETIGDIATSLAEDGATWRPVACASKGRQISNLIRVLETQVSAIDAAIDDFKDKLFPGKKDSRLSA
jgi:hypothetical protein